MATSAPPRTSPRIDEIELQQNPLHSVVVRVEHVQTLARVADDAPRLLELARLMTRLTPCGEEFAVATEFLNTMVAELA